MLQALLWLWLLVATIVCLQLVSAIRRVHERTFKTVNDNQSTRERIARKKQAHDEEWFTSTKASLEQDYREQEEREQREFTEWKSKHDVEMQRMQMERDEIRRVRLDIQRQTELNRDQLENQENEWLERIHQNDRQQQDRRSREDAENSQARLELLANQTGQQEQALQALVQTRSSNSQLDATMVAGMMEQDTQFEANQQANIERALTIKQTEAQTQRIKVMEEEKRKTQEHQAMLDQAAREAEAEIRLREQQQKHNQEMERMKEKNAYAERKAEANRPVVVERPRPSCERPQPSWETPWPSLERVLPPPVLPEIPIEIVLKSTRNTISDLFKKF